MQRVLGSLVVAAALLAAVPAAAQANGWVCEASALRAQVLTAPAIEPATANRGAGDCKQASGGGGVTPALPVGLRATALTASTVLDGPVAPASDQVARSSGIISGVAISALPGLPIDLPQPVAIDRVRPGGRIRGIRPSTDSAATTQQPQDMASGPRVYEFR